MRTTIDVDDDVLMAVKELAKREKRSAGEVLSEIAREALTKRQPQGEVRESESFYGIRPLPHRGVVVTNDLINRLRDDDPDA